MSSDLYEALAPWKNKLQVQLKDDLTHYDSSLAPGAIGTVVEFFGPQGEQHWQVYFGAAGTLNVLRKNLQILDEQFNQQLKDAENNRISRLLREVSEAVLYVNRKGEYQALYVWKKSGESEPAISKEEADKLLRLFQERGVAVSREVWA